jgi:hypothetical protein
MAIVTGNDPLSGAPDAGVRGRSAYGAAPSNQPPSIPAVAFPLPDPLADSSQNYMQYAVGPGPSAVSFPLQDPVSGEAVVHPWKVRWHAPKDENGNADGPAQLEIYIPGGSAAVAGSNVYVVNTKSENKGGGHAKDDVDLNWRLIPSNFSNKDAVYKVEVHVKGHVRMSTGDDQYTTPEAFIYVALVDINDTDISKQLKRGAGDIINMVAAYVTTRENAESTDGMPAILISQMMNAAVFTPSRQSSQLSTGYGVSDNRFVPVWKFSFNEGDGTISLDGVAFESRGIDIGGFTAEAEDEDFTFSGSDMTYVYVEIDVSESSEPEVAIRTGTEVPASTASKFNVQLYQMRGPTLYADTRDRLDNLRFYAFLREEEEGA